MVSNLKCFWLIIMKTIASLEVALATDLTERLSAESIPFEIQPGSQEGGLEVRDVLVTDTYYDRACEVAEAWDAGRCAEIEKKSNRRCPSCGSLHVDFVGAARLGGSVWKCANCGRGFAK